MNGPGWGAYSRQFRIGVCRQDSQTLTLFKGRKSRIDTLLKAQNQEMAPYTYLYSVYKEVPPPPGDERKLSIIV